MGNESAEQARTRRRWITLAEFVAVAGLLIGVLTLYLNWSERRDDQAAKASENAAAQKREAIVTLTGKVVEGGKAIDLADSGHEFSAASVRFPNAMGVGVQDAMPGPRIAADWFASKLLALTDGGADDQTGRLPVLVTTLWWDGEAKRTATARYDILWRTSGRMLRGRELRLTGLALADRSASVAALDAAWKRQPAAK